MSFFPEQQNFIAGTNSGGQMAYTLQINRNNSQDFWYVGASSSNLSFYYNNGIRSMIEVKNQSVLGVLAFWVSEATGNGLWAQVGYYIDNGSSPFAFYQIWNLTNRAEIATGGTAVAAGIHIFSLSLSNATIWNFRVDSSVLGTFDMRTNTSSPQFPISAMSEEGYSQHPFGFSKVTFLSGMQVLKGGSWENVTDASSYGNSWGIQGNMQSPRLSANEFAVGESYPIVASNSPLWA
jgi:hypothetical protein